MGRSVLSLFSFFLCSLLYLPQANASNNVPSAMYLGSRESDPASLVQNVSVIHGDYSEVEVDLIVPAPDSLILSRFYSSRDTLPIASFGGWRFNPHCFLTMQKDLKGKKYNSVEGEFERTYVRLGAPEGSILTYVGWKNSSNNTKRTLFQIDPEEDSIGLVNTARGEISALTNLKNNELYYNAETDSFELALSTGGRRFYSKSLASDLYLITHEILPSGNKVFYEFDEEEHLSLIKETNALEKKVLAWIEIRYENGVHIETSDGKTVRYQFEQGLLTSVIRSDKPNLHYQYKLVDNRALLLKKTLPEGRFVEIDYYTNKVNRHKVRSVTTPISVSESATTEFIYEDDFAEVIGPGNCKSVCRFDEDLHLVAIEQYLDGSLYRIHKKTWGIRSDTSNLLSTSVTDGDGNIFYHKLFVYDRSNRGNIIEEREYGDIAGTGAIKLIVDEDGLVTNQDGHITYTSYFTGKTSYGFLKGDAKGSGVKYWYKNGTNLLLKKFILTKGSSDKEEEGMYSGIRERHFYFYNEDASLIRVVVDDHEHGADFKEAYGLSERMITDISPKKELPNLGAPEIVHQKYSSLDGKSEFLLKRTINQFDDFGFITSQAVYDASDRYRYSVTKGYEQGLLVFETDPMGNETHYAYDENFNLVSESHSNTGLVTEYGYDLRNYLIQTAQKDKTGNRFETKVSYDQAGYKISEVDRFGKETTYVNDSLGRPISILYPEAYAYTYAYDLFDNQISITDPKGGVTLKSYTVHGKESEVSYPDGTKESFRYDGGGNLHHHYARNGLLEVFESDYKGRVTRVRCYESGNTSSGYAFKAKSYKYSAFRKILETDESDGKTIYVYDLAGRLSKIEKDIHKIGFVYDDLGRTQGVKKWKNVNEFTLEIKEYDLLDRVIEERIEDAKGQILIKKNYVYNEEGRLFQVIGYPQNKESILIRYEYDGFGTLQKTTSAVGQVTETLYDEKGQKRSLIDPMGNQIDEIFNAIGNLIKLSKKNKQGQLLSSIEMSYDAFGNKINDRSIVLSDGSLRDYEASRSFNQKDQLESITLGKGGDKEQTTRFTYNTYGDLSAKYNPGFSEPITYLYNNRGLLETVSYKEGKKEAKYRLSYDLKGHLTGMEQEALSQSYLFYTNDMLASETSKDEFGSYQVKYYYDGEGNIRAFDLPDGSSVKYTYEGPFVKSISRFSKEGNPLYTHQIASRDQMGNVLEEVLPGILGGRKQLWDEAGRRVEIATDFFQDKVPEGGYDLLDNIKKRETTLDDEKILIEYGYNDLSQLTFEKGEEAQAYSYDSIGNRLQKNDSFYKVNSLNELIETEDTFYTYDLNGNLATKKVGNKIWTYQSNPRNQLVSIKDPDQNTTTFTYDLMGKRLSKRIEAKGKKTRILRFFYLYDTEIGCVDEKGIIVELKIPSNPNNPEAPAIAIEVEKDVYVPLYDLQGNIACLLDHKNRKIVESYRYSIYGEETIKNGKGREISDSSIGNPWRYRAKRVDKEAGLIYFGCRYYDFEIGRWISPDPAGAIDGLNLYAFARNNPLKYVDYFGFNSEIAENCPCVASWSSRFSQCPVRLRLYMWKR